MLEEDMGGLGAVAEAVNLVLDELAMGFHELSPRLREALNRLEQTATQTATADENIWNVNLPVSSIKPLDKKEKW